MICWNNLSFIQNFVEQLKKYPNPIILLDNNSNYLPIFDYYKQIQKEIPNKVKVVLLQKNYGHEVYKILKNDDIVTNNLLQPKVEPFVNENIVSSIEEIGDNED